MTDETTEWEWEAFSTTAMTAYNAGRWPEARHLWHQARELSTSFAADDPRRATSSNNAAISYLIDEDYTQAREQFEQTLLSWQTSLRWTDTMIVGAVARSSLFHLRMEQRHQDAFTEFRRSRNRESLKGAIALTQFNKALTHLFLDQDGEADLLLATAAEEREKSFGPNSPELAQILRVRSGRCEILGDAEAAHELELKARAIQEAPARPALEHWAIDQPNKMNDMRRLNAANYLTAMIHERDFL